MDSTIVYYGLLSVFADHLENKDGVLEKVTGLPSGAQLAELWS